MPGAAPHRDELSAYAAGRWPAVVRALILLGAPPRHASGLAAEAVSRFLDRCADDGDGGWVDLDVVLGAEVIAAWEDDVTAWWGRPDLLDDADLAGTGVPEVLAGLDPLAPAARSRLALAVTLGLVGEQLDEAVASGDEAVAGLPVLADTAAAALALVPVGEPLLDEADARSRRRVRAGRRRTAVVVVAVLAAVAALVPVVSTALDREPRSGQAGRQTEERSAPAPTSREVEPPAQRPEVSYGRRPDLVPAPWYDGRRVHLADRTVRVPGVQALAVAADGVVTTDRRGNVVHVRAGGTTEVLGRTGPDATALAGGDLAAWTDGDVLVVRRLADDPGGEVRVPLPPGGRVVAVDGGRVHLDSADGPLVVGRSGTAEEGATPQVLDVAADVVLSRRGVTLLARSPVGVRELIAVDGLLSPDGTYALVRSVASSSSAATRVVVTATGREVVVPLPPGSVQDSSFGGAGQATFVVARPDASPYLADGAPAPRDEYPGHDVVVCDIGRGLCRAVAQAPDADLVPVLAR